MSNNLNRTVLTTNQTQKETTVNNSDGRLDAAITEEDVSNLVFSGAQSLKTLTAEQMRASVHFVVSGTTSAPTPVVKTANLKRGIVAFTNNLSSDLQIEDYGTLLANITIPAGGTYVIMCTTTGNRAIVRGVDSVFTLNIEPSVKAATTANITLAGSQTIDGVSVTPGDRVLVKDQSTGSQNGVYTVVDPGAWTRASAAWGQGTAFAVEPGGTANGGTVWMLTTPPPIVIGTTSLAFSLIATDFFATFTSLTDAPTSYTGQALKVVAVKGTEDGLEFVEIALSAKSWKDSVRVATTGNITLTNEQTIDGVPVVEGDRVLVKDQTAGEENGLYVCVSGGAWTRAEDMDTDVETTCGIIVSVEEGDTQAGKLYRLSTVNPIALDTDSLTWDEIQTGGGGGSTAWKDPCRAATTANITIATALNPGDSLDGVTLAQDDRVLVKNQSTASQNGIYIVDASPFRATDCDEDAEVVPGFAVMVQEGTANADKAYKLTTNGAITVGSTSLTFAKFNPTLFTELADVPSSYSGQTLKGVRVNAGETALEFYTTVVSFTQLTDVPSSYSGQALKGVRVNAGETALEFYTPASAEIGINTQTASYTLVLGDNVKYVRMNVGSANDLTVPANGTVAFAIGTQIPIRSIGAGQTTVVQDTGVTVNIPVDKTLKLRTQGSSGLLTKVGTNEWDLTGDLEDA